MPVLESNENKSTRASKFSKERVSRGGDSEICFTSRMMFVFHDVYDMHLSGHGREQGAKNEASTLQDPQQVPKLVHAKCKSTGMFHGMFVPMSGPDLTVDRNRAPKTEISRYVCHPPICFTICLFIRTDLDGHRAPMFQDMFVH